MRSNTCSDSKKKVKKKNQSTIVYWEANPEIFRSFVANDKIRRSDRVKIAILEMLPIKMSIVYRTLLVVSSDGPD